MGWAMGTLLCPLTDANVDSPGSEDCGFCPVHKNADNGGELQPQDEPVGDSAAGIHGPGPR